MSSSEIDQRKQIHIYISYKRSMQDVPEKCAIGRVVQE